MMMQLKENIRPLPLPSFKLFTTGYLPATIPYRSSLAQTILDGIVTTAAPSKRATNDDTLTLGIFMRMYLPYTANTLGVSENVKMAILVEVLARLLFSYGEFEWSRELEETTEKGIRERRRKGTKWKKGEDVEEVMRVWDAADAKLRLLVRMARAKANGR